MTVGSERGHVHHFPTVRLAPSAVIRLPTARFLQLACGVGGRLIVSYRLFCNRGLRDCLSLSLLSRFICRLLSFHFLSSARPDGSARSVPRPCAVLSPFLSFVLKWSFYINPPDGNHPEVDLSLALIGTWKPSRLCSLCPFLSTAVLFFTPSSLFLECPERADILKNTGPPPTPRAGVVTAYWSAV